MTDKERAAIIDKLGYCEFMALYWRDYRQETNQYTLDIWKRLGHKEKEKWCVAFNDMSDEELVALLLAGKSE